MSSFTSNVFKLSFGTLIAQAIGIAVAPILSRLFAPEAFGALGLFTSITGVIGAVACLRYDLAIMLPREDKQALNLLVGSVLFAALVSLLCAICIGMAGNHLMRLFNAGQLSEYIWLIPLMVFLVGCFSAANYWYSRTQDFGKLVVMRLINSLSTNFLKVFMGLSGYLGGSILILATFIGQLITTLIVSIKMGFSDRTFFKNSFDLKEIFNLVYRYRRFPQYEVWSGILVDLSLKLPIFMIAYFFSQKELGYFVFVQAVVRVPFNIVGESISKVFYQKATNIRDNIGEMSGWIENVFYFLTTFCMLPALIVSIIGIDIFNLVFGPNWTEAGIYAQILIFAILVEFITAPIGSLFNVLEKQKEALHFNIGLMLLRFTALVIGGLTGKILMTIFIFVIADIIGRIIKFAYIFKQSNFRTSKAFGIFVKALLCAAPFLICLIILKYAVNFSALANICCAVLLIIVNYFVMMHKNHFFKTQIAKRSVKTSEVSK
jgi:O-antigen/teichoic acid export membrane protein